MAQNVETEVSPDGSAVASADLALAEQLNEASHVVGEEPKNPDVADTKDSIPKDAKKSIPENGRSSIPPPARSSIVQPQTASETRLSSDHVTETIADSSVTIATAVPEVPTAQVLNETADFSANDQGVIESSKPDPEKPTETTKTDEDASLPPFEPKKGSLQADTASEPTQEGADVPAQPSESVLSAAHSGASGESDQHTPQAENAAAVLTVIMEKQPAIGQLQLKELLSGTSMQIVEYAQKLAEAPLVGSTGLRASAPEDASKVEPRTNISVAQDTVTASNGAAKRTVIGTVTVAEDQFPGPDHEESLANQSTAIAAPEEELTDTEPYDVYTIPDNVEKLDDVPTLLKRYFQLYSDEKLPVARHFKVEDEERLNEAAGWEIQPSYQTKPCCVIRASILEKVLRGILEFRLGKYSIVGIESRQIKQLMPVLSEDVASTLALCRFPRTSWIPYQYFVKAEGPMNHESIEERQEIAEAEYRAPNVMRRK